MNPVNEHILALQAYQPGFQPEEGTKAVKLNTNENPYPPSPCVLEAIRDQCTDALRLYPDPGSRKLRQAAASLYGFDPQQILPGNGSDEILGIVMRTFATPGDPIGYYVPSYSYYETLGAIHALELVPTPLGDDLLNPPLPKRRDLKLFFLTNPNSPLGFSLQPEFAVRLARHIRGALVIDEAYADFARLNCLPLVKALPNVIVTRSLSKSYSLAGLRVGIAIGPPHWIEQMDKVRDHYNLSRIAQAAATAALGDQAYFQDNLRRVLATRQRVLEFLRALGIPCRDSEANFVFARFATDQVASATYRTLLDRGILVRHFPHRGLRDGLRISIGTDREMDRLLKELANLLEKRP